MMNFRNIKNSIITILDTAAAGRFEVIGSQRQRQGAEDINSQKKVMVYFLSDTFSENSGSINGTVQSFPVFRIMLEVSAKGTYTDSSDPNTLTSANLVADNMFDELADNVYQILMSGENLDIGQPVGQVGNRYIKTIEKNDINKDGEFVIITGSMDLSCITPETVPEEMGTAATINKSSFAIGEDTHQATGIQVGE